MAKPSPTRNAFGNDAHQFVDRSADYLSTPCAWRGCGHPRWDGTPVCMAHALEINGRIHDSKQVVVRDAPPLPRFQSFVYYLMVGPATVKIGTSEYLPWRIKQLRSEMQYVVALEMGTYDVERQRHLQFASERIGRREDFALSDRLKQHINHLQPRREELMRLAIEHKPLTATG